LKTDLRGKPHPDTEDVGGCDMGAYESQNDSFRSPVLANWRNIPIAPAIHHRRFHSHVTRSEHTACEWSAAENEPTFREETLSGITRHHEEQHCSVVHEKTCWDAATMLNVLSMVNSPGQGF